MDVEALRAALAGTGGRWYAGQTVLSQLSPREKVYRLGYVPGTNDLPLNKRITLSAHQMPPAKPAVAPRRWDWRNAGGVAWTTAVKDQGRCGSCVAFASVAPFETQIRINQGIANFTINLSEAQLWSCWGPSHGAGSCPSGGWSVGAAYDGLIQGVVDSACFAYAATNQPCNLCTGWTARLWRIGSWHSLTDISEMKKYLSEIGPLTTALTVYDDFYHYMSGIYHPISDLLIGGHCVCVVGYDDGDRCWICKNSWGETFGEEGYFRIQYGSCGIDAQMWAIDGIVPPSV